ncbi:hypothetical protein [Vibrio scophthalmi]|uniref:Uncharacterized protein n=1 Tax=Vibrio scophthalmi TaxID=45658 RepID=A0A1E3WJR4_9VIBR|nr:hypothetical protein [Vibrio scophthalmi]ODS09747.1 hypothetical protein VSF3289_03209 [Vibrio scophthalmi]
MAKRSITHIVTDNAVMSDEAKPEVFAKTVRGIPNRLDKEFKDLKTKGKVHGTLNSYMVYALAQQLERDKA